MIGIPLSLAKLTNGFDWEPITIGHSEAMTFLLKGSHEHRYLKVQPVHTVERLFDEKEKMKWLEGKLPVPRVLFYEKDEANEYLLMSEIKGVNASDQSHRGNLPAVIESLGAGLMTIHSIGSVIAPLLKA